MYAPLWNSTRLFHTDGFAEREFLNEGLLHSMAHEYIAILLWASAVLYALMLYMRDSQSLLHHLYRPFHALLPVALREEELSVAIELVFAGLARNKHRYVRPRHLRVVLHARVRLVNDEAVGY